MAHYTFHMGQIARFCFAGSLLLTLLFSSPMIAQLRISGPAGDSNAVRVPFVGCNTDGQTGPVKAPKGQSKIVSVSAEAARRLAFYSAGDKTGILAPKGWNCFSTYGSNGSTLFVSPTAIDHKSLFSSEWKGFSGPAIQISFSYGDTSGRFSVAKTIARVFPDYSKFVQDVVAEGIQPASSFPSGPYPSDSLYYRGKRIVEFQTPGNSEGLGTQSRLLKSASPINGVAILIGPEPNLVQLSMRLTPDTDDLARFIVQQLEHDTGEMVSSGK